jgi:hypothetical protein
MVFAKMKPIPPLEMGSETCQCTKGTFGHQNNMGLKNLSKIYMKIELKK